jgi:hypothetical protein
MKGISESGTGRNVAQPVKARIKRIEGKIKKTRGVGIITRRNSVLTWWQI